MPGIGRDTVAQDGAIIVYDGACPLCSRYVLLLRLRSAVGPVQLVDMREGGPVVDSLRVRGFALDQGMVLIHRGVYYHGADCIHRLALLTTRSDSFNRLTAAIFRSALLSRVLYPLLRCGRNLALRLLRRPPVDAPHRAAQDQPRYRSLVLAVPVLLVSYATIALSHTWATSAELFPFFNWSLFSSPKVDARRYAVRITAVGPPDAYGEALVGRRLDDVDSLGILRDVRFHKTTRALARAYRRGDNADVEQLRALLGNFLQPYGITEFELLQLTYDPFAYYYDGETAAETVIGRFRGGDGG